MRAAISLLALIPMCAAFAADPPALSAKSAIVIDEKSGKVLFEKSADARRFPASTTKILTSLLLLERCSPDEKILAPWDVDKIEGSSLHLVPGESITAKDALYALLVRSANDVAYSVAVHIGGSVSGFAKLMNQRAKEIGCKHSHFTSPNGLHDPNHYTTARDMALIAREAMKNPTFRKAAATRIIFIDRDFNYEDRLLVSRNKFLANDPTADGIKTGYTIPAGQCFVGSATRNGYRFIAVIFHSKHWEKDHKALINWAFRKFERSVVADKGTIVGNIALGSGPANDIPVRLSEPVYYAHRKGTHPVLRSQIETPADLRLPITEGQPMGEVVYTDGKSWKYHAKIEAAATVESNRAEAAAKNFGFALMVGGVGVGAFVANRKARR